jgi:PAS domain S-box-containing protein
MQRSGKNNEQEELVRKGTKKQAKVELLRPQAEHIKKLPNDLAKFPEENPLPVLRVHKDGIVLYANKASEPLLKAKNSGAGLPAPSKWRRLVEAVLASGRMVREDVEYNGRIFEFLAVPIAERDYVNFYGDDVTEHKRTEQALQESEDKLRTLANQSFDGIVIHDGNKILEVNKRFCEMWGCDSEQVIGMRVDEFIIPEWLDVVREKIRCGYDKPYELVAVRRDGTRFPVEIAGKTITYKGKPAQIAATRDITERKAAEQKHLDDKKQLKQLASQLTLTEERQRRRFAEILHDQLGQPLAMAKIKMDTFRASQTSVPDEKILSDVSDTLQNLIDQTRALTFDLGHPVLYELGFEVAVADWLNEQVHDKHGIDVEFEDDGLPKPLDNDVQVMLFRNVRELLINCIKHSRAGKVNVRIRRLDDFIEITVTDNGIGFDLVEAKEKAGKKTKFGLFSIQESLDHLCGHFEIESKPGAGCRAKIIAPLKGCPCKGEE